MTVPLSGAQCPSSLSGSGHAICCTLDSPKSQARSGSFSEYPGRGSTHLERITAPGNPPPPTLGRKPRSETDGHQGMGGESGVLAPKYPEPPLGVSRPHPPRGPHLQEAPRKQPGSRPEKSLLTLAGGRKPRAFLAPCDLAPTEAQR